MLLAAPMAALSQDLGDDGFATPDSVAGTLAATAERQSKGALESFQAWKKELEGRTGLSFGFDDQVQYLGTNSDRSPSDAVSNVFRFYGTWTAVGRGTPNDGALVFKVENRSAIGSNISTQALGPSLGYAGLFSTTFSDAGWVLTNFYWRQRLLNNRVSFVVGQLDVTDYVDVNNLSNPWTGFTSQAFEQLPTFPAPSQGLGAALQWRLNEQWAVLGGFADANADAADPIGSAQGFFETGETFKHLAIGWSPNWDDRFDQAVQLTLWQVDDRETAGVEGGQGVAFAASTRVDQWRPFLRAGYAEGGGTFLDRAISVGTGYDALGGRDLAGIGMSWGRAPGNSRDQYTVEAFYRFDLTDFLQVTPEIQYIVDPANDLTADDILVLGFRLRVAF
jgi:porin